MKKLGLIGGSGPESTLVYYKEINTRINQMSGETCFPEFTIESINLYRISEFRVADDMEGMKEYLLKGIRNLAAAGAEIGALTAGTLHMVFDDLAKESPIPLISIPEIVSKVAKERGYRKVGILGTDVTMKKDFMKKPFMEKGIDVIAPKEEEMELVNHRIFTELENAIIKPSTEKELIDIINRMKEENGIEAVILGCTELPLILNQGNSPVDVLDIMRIHIEELTKIMMESEEIN